MSILYLDTSVVVHALAGGTAAVRSWFDDVTERGDDILVSSRLLRTELIRVLRREGRELSEGFDILDNVSMLPISESVLTHAEAIVDRIKTLDAVHVASALQLGSATVVVSHDDTLKRVAATLGLATFDPVVQHG